MALKISPEGRAKQRLRIHLCYSIIRDQHSYSDRFTSWEINGITIGHFTSFKAHWTQVLADSRREQTRQIGAQKGSNSLQPHQMFSQKYDPVSVLGQHLPRLKSFKVNSKSSPANKFSIHSRFSQHQHHRRKRRQRCLSSRSPSATMMLKKNFVSDSDKLQGVSKGFSHLLIEGSNIKEKIQDDSVVHSLSSSSPSSWFRWSWSSGSGSSSWISSDGVRVSSWSATTSSSAAESRISGLDESV